MLVVLEFVVLVGGLVGLLVGGGVIGPPYGPAVSAAPCVPTVVGFRGTRRTRGRVVVNTHSIYHVYPDAVVAHNELTGPHSRRFSARINEVTASSDTFVDLVTEW